jgi:hypothetical protein
VPIYKKGDITDCSNYRGMSLLSTWYKILSSILLSRSNPRAGEITGNQRCEFWCNRKTTDHIFNIRQILEKKQVCKDTVHQLFVDFNESYDSVGKDIYTVFSMIVDYPRK